MYVCDVNTRGIQKGNNYITSVIICLYINNTFLKNLYTSVEIKLMDYNKDEHDDDDLTSTEYC